MSVADMIAVICYAKVSTLSFWQLKNVTGRLMFIIPYIIQTCNFVSAMFSLFDLKKRNKEKKSKILVWIISRIVKNIKIDVLNHFIKFFFL